MRKIYAIERGGFNQRPCSQTINRRNKMLKIFNSLRAQYARVLCLCNVSEPLAIPAMVRRSAVISQMGCGRALVTQGFSHVFDTRNVLCRHFYSVHSFFV